MDQSFLRTNGEKRGIIIEEYNGTYSLVSAEEGRDGKVWSVWAYPQSRVSGEKAPGDKAWPVRVILGKSKKEAIATLRHFLEALTGDVQVDGGVQDDLPF